MATLFMLMGLPGSGKTTLARRLERERPALVLSPDVWMSRIVGDGYDFKRREAVTEVQLVRKGWPVPWRWQKIPAGK